jgi:hypothetical protein
MKVLKISGIVLLILIAVPLLVALFLPKSYTVSVSETISRPRQEVYDYMRILKNQQHYSVWFKEDPDMVPVIQGTDGTVGAIQRWDSEKMGAGEQEIKVLTRWKWNCASSGLLKESPMRHTCSKRFPKMKRR